ncbi:hypothetical protein GUY40_11220 [Pseudomonas sp. R5(2019)]|nr:hypothetical protein [Pseudomonas sp. R5(2019)]
MLLKPDLAEFRYALYCRSHLMDLPGPPQPPVSLYRDKRSAELHGVRMWPSTFTVVDLAGDDQP